VNRGYARGGPASTTSRDISSGSRVHQRLHPPRGAGFGERAEVDRLRLGPCRAGVPADHDVERPVLGQARPAERGHQLGHLLRARSPDPEAHPTTLLARCGSRQLSPPGWAGNDQAPCAEHHVHAAVGQDLGCAVMARPNAGDGRFEPGWRAKLDLAAADHSRGPGHRAAVNRGAVGVEFTERAG